MSTATPQWKNIGEFRFGFEDGRHFQIMRSPDADAVRVDRQHPDPARGRNVARATGLATADPQFTFPSNWTDQQHGVARAAISTCWKRDQVLDRQEAAEPAGIALEVE